MFTCFSRAIDRILLTLSSFSRERGHRCEGFHNLAPGESRVSPMAQHDHKRKLTTLGHKILKKSTGVMMCHAIAFT